MKPGKFSYLYEASPGELRRADTWFESLAVGEVCAVRTWLGPPHLVRVVEIDRSGPVVRTTVRSCDGRNVHYPNQYNHTQVIFLGRTTVEGGAQNNGTWGCSLWPADPKVAGDGIERVAIRRVVFSYESDLFDADGPPAPWFVGRIAS